MIQSSIITNIIIVLICISIYFVWIYVASVVKFNFIAFDFLFTSIITFPILSRVLGVLKEASFYIDQGFSIFPFIQNAQGEAKLSSELPWSLIKFWDGNLYFFCILLVPLIAQIVIKKAHTKVKLRDEAPFIANLNVFAAVFFLFFSFYSTINDYEKTDIQLSLLSEQQRTLIVLSLLYFLWQVILKVALRKNLQIWVNINWASFLGFIIILISFDISEISTNFIAFLSGIILLLTFLTFNFYKTVSSKRLRS